MAIGGVTVHQGDSLTFGARDEKGLNYPEALARLLSAKYGQFWTAVNFGVSGETSAQILRRNYKEIRGISEAYEVFLWAGFNDAKVNVATPPEEYQANMESMLRTILFMGKACYLFDLPPMEGFGAPDFVRNDLIEAYNAKIKELWNKYANYRLYYVKVRDIPAEYRNDGVHLTHAGNQWVAERALAAVEYARNSGASREIISIHDAPAQLNAVI